MYEHPQEWQIHLTCPTLPSVADQFARMIERKAGALPPDGWPANRPFYLEEDVDTVAKVFGDDIEKVMSEKEPSSKVGVQAGVEPEVLQRIWDSVNGEPEKLHSLNTLSIVAFERYRARLTKRAGEIHDAD